MVYPKEITVGININLRYDDSIYVINNRVNNWVIPRLKELGVKLVRDGGIGANFINRIRSLPPDIKLCMSVEPRVGIYPDNIVQLCLDIGLDRIAFIEGVNEWDGGNISYQHGSYNVAYPESVREVQKQVWQALKGDCRTSHIPVLSASFAQAENIPNIPYALTPYCDGLSMHSYMPNQEVNDSYFLDTRWIGNTKTLAPRRKIVVTETGYAGIESYPDALDEATKAVLIPKIAYKNFQRGINTTILFELYDSADGHWGLIKNDNTPKPCFYSLKAEMGR